MGDRKIRCVCSDPAKRPGLNWEFEMRKVMFGIVALAVLGMSVSFSYGAGKKGGGKKHPASTSAPADPATPEAVTPML